MPAEARTRTIILYDHRGLFETRNNSEFEWHAADCTQMLIEIEDRFGEMRGFPECPNLVFQTIRGNI